MKKKALAAILVATMILAGCGQQEDSNTVQGFEQETLPTQTETEPVAEEKEFSIITDRTVVDGKMQSYLTGEWKDADVVQRRNMAVMVPNNKPALPQYGISQASIIYEAPMESGSCTRFMCIFEDYDDLERIGPVRSARDYFMYESMSYDSIFCNWGLAVPYVGPVINTDRVDNISQSTSGIDSPSSEAFDRVERGSGYATEFTGYMFIDGYEKAVARHKYETTYEGNNRFDGAFLFADEGCRAEYEDYPDATVIKPGGDAKNSGGYNHTNPVFTYDETDHLYYRSQLNAPQTDEYNKEQLAVSNVIFKVCNGSMRDDHGYLEFGVFGDGESYVFTNGKVIKGTWERDADYVPTRFLDENGEEIVMNQGKTWVCIIWGNYKDCISYE